MKFENKNKCIYRQWMERKSKSNGKTFYLVKISDPVTFETYDFFPENVEDFKALAPNSEVTVALETNGSFTSLVLVRDKNSK